MKTSSRKQCLRMKEKRRERRLSEGEGEVTPDRRNSMDKVPVMRLEEVYSVWSSESEGSSVDHMIAMGWGPDHTRLGGPGVILVFIQEQDQRLKAFFLPFLTHFSFSLLLIISHCLGFWLLSQSNSCSQSFSFSHYQSLTPKIF